MRRTVIGLAVATAIAATADARAGDAAGGFHLLRLGGEAVRWVASVSSLPAVVTYAIVDRPMQFPDARNCGAMEPLHELLKRSRISRRAFDAEVRAAFKLWSDAANIRFVQTKDVDRAGIRIGAQRQPEGRAFADVAYRNVHAGFNEIERSLICLNPRRTWKIGFDGNLAVYDLRYTIAHEIGHAIGLDHASPTNQIMSQRYQESFRTLQAGDIGGAVQIYGPAAPGGASAVLASDTAPTQARR